MIERRLPSCILVVFLIQGCLSAADKTLLFDADDKVVIYNKFDYRAGIYSGETAHLFLLYSSWCGHCQRFAPTYIDLAESISSWSDTVLVTGVDCVPDTDVCKVFNVRGYPTLRFIGPTTNVSDTGITYEETRTVNKMKEWIITTLSEVKDPPSSWPVLQALTETEADSYLSKPEDEKQLVLIVSEENIGREVLVELHSPSVRYALTGTNAANALGAKIPGIAVILSGKVTYHTVKGDSAADYVKLIERLVGGNADVSNGGIVENGEVNQDSSVVDTSLQYQLYELDMQSALNIALYTEVGLKTTFSDKELEDLKRFLLVANQCGSWTSHYRTLLSQIKREVYDLTELDSDSWHGILKNAADGGFPRNSTFIGCKGSQPTTRGYPCGLWLLFHSMLASCYSPDSNTTAPTSVTVLHAIHGYVDSFFTCEHCRSHFLAMSERMELLAITDDKAANLAMWQAHNQVNARLSTEVYDLHFPKVQFPPLDECGTCANAQQFDTDKVFGYLMKHYRRVLTPFGKMRITLQRLQSKGNKKKKGKKNNQGKKKGKNSKV